VTDPLGECLNLCDGDEPARSKAEAVVRRSYGKLIAFLCVS
jgi:hypothetical protein